MTLPAEITNQMRREPSRPHPRPGLRRRTALGTTAGALALAACGPDARSPGAGPGTGDERQVFKIVDSFAPRGLDPIEDSSNLVTYGMGEKLIRLGRKGALEPWIAASWRSLDSLRWEIKLRDGVTFWNGNAADATAIKESLERTLSRKAVAREQLPSASIDVTDARTLVIRTEAPTASVPAALAAWDFVIHDARAARTMGDEAFALQPVLTGPFRPVEFKRDELVALERHDAYWGGRPQAARIEARYVRDGNTRVMALQSGDADMGLNLPTEAVATLRKQPGFRVHEVLGAALEWLFLNPRVAPLDEVAVRHAISLGIDRKQLAVQVLEGTVDIATDIYSPIFSWALKNAYPTDAARAAKLLDDAGWKPGADAIRIKNGKPLAFVATWYPQRADLQPLGIAIQAQLRKLGIKVDLRMVEQGAQALDAGDWGAAVYYHSSAPGGDPQFILDNFIHSGGVRNLGYKNREVDRLIDQVRTTVDQTERFKVLRRVQEMLAQEGPMLPLVAKKDIFAVNERLKNTQPNALTFYVDAPFGR